MEAMLTLTLLSQCKKNKERQECYPAGSGSGSGSGSGLRLGVKAQGQGSWLRVRGRGSGSGSGLGVEGQGSGSGLGVEGQGSGLGSRLRVRGRGSGSGSGLGVDGQGSGSGLGVKGRGSGLRVRLRLGVEGRGSGSGSSSGCCRGAALTALPAETGARLSPALDLLGKLCRSQNNANSREAGGANESVWLCVWVWGCWGGYLAGSWGTPPPLTARGHQSRSLCGRGPLNTGMLGPPKVWLYSIPRHPPLSPRPNRCPTHTKVRQGAWEGLEVHGQTSY